MTKLNQGKITIFFSLIVLLILLGLVGFIVNQWNPSESKEQEFQEGIEETVSLIIDYGEGQPLLSEAEFREGMTAFDLLVGETSKAVLGLETKTYDMGVFVEKIGGKKNGEEGKYWLYYLNEEMPMVSSDKQILKVGDKVEFKFEASSF